MLIHEKKGRDKLCTNAIVSVSNDDVCIHACLWSIRAGSWSRRGRVDQTFGQTKENVLPSGPAVECLTHLIVIVN